jgi:hypothetical protein
MFCATRSFSMRREAAFLDDIVRSADAIIEICSGLQLGALIAVDFLAE